MLILLSGAIGEGKGNSRGKWEIIQFIQLLLLNLATEKKIDVSDTEAKRSFATLLIQKNTLRYNIWNEKKRQIKNFRKIARKKLKK